MRARIVFDLDGTLIDSAPDLHAVANDLLRREGAGDITLDQARSFIGEGTSVFVARMRAAAGIPDSEQDRLLAGFLAAYEGAVGLTRPYPGVPEALEALRQAGHRLGLCTNKPAAPAHAVLRHLGLAGFLDCVIAGDSLPERKPDPAPLQAALAALGDGRPVYVGDSEIDAETARRAGVPFLLFTQGYRKRPVEELPHAGRLDGFDELPRLIAGLAVAG
ncbi:MAG: phosphoglycolate phosphatase [Alphaproteobacteria bacterium]|nr:MAG: phosphoglycolate phosphatase [Alphaproteobacteria bacterium]